MDTRILVGKHATIHRDHPMRVSLVNQMQFRNPVVERAERYGRQAPEGAPEYITLFERVGDWYQFPRGVADKLKARFPIVDQTSPGEDVSMPSLITLRDYQVEWVNKVEAALRAGFGTVGQAEPGFGKTISFLELASRIGKKTLIVVHKELLMTQWVERILGTIEGRKRLGEFGLISKALANETPKEVFPPALDIAREDVGFLQQDLVEFEGKKIIVAMAQSLYAREYPQEYYDSIGLLGIDEVHRFSAPTFQKVISYFPAAKRLGVTATPDRKDGLEDIFFYHIGPISAVGTVPRPKPRVNLVPTVVRPSLADEAKMKRYGRVDTVKVIDFIVEHSGRNQQIIGQLLKAAEKGRKILVLSERRKHLEDLKDLFAKATQAQNLPYSADFYVGGMDLAARTRAEQMQVLFATWHMAEEGMDIPALDTLFMVTPRNGVEQAVGRILRIRDEKRAPVVVDFVDSAVKTLSNRADRRRTEYRKLGWL